MYKPPIIKKPLTVDQQSVLNLARMIGKNHISLKEAYDLYDSYRYPNGPMKKVCDQMRLKASYHKGYTDCSGNLKRDYLLHCLGDPTYVVEYWDCKLVRKQILEYKSELGLYIPTNKFEEYYNIHLKGYWLHPPKHPIIYRNYTKWTLPKHLKHYPLNWKEQRLYDLQKLKSE